MRPRIPSASTLVKRFEDVDRAGIYSNFGPQVRELEQRFATFLGVPDSSVVTVSSATSGISLAAHSLDRRRWVLPSWTFSATAAAIVGSGFDALFQDIDSESHWMKQADLDRDQGIVLVAPFGEAVKSKALRADCPVIVDAAASIGSPIPKSLQKFPNCAVVYSLHATKVLGMGEGGLIVCGSEALAQEIRDRSNFGFGEGRVSHRIGMNAKLSEYAAVFGHGVLDHLEREFDEWRESRETVSGISREFGLRSLYTQNNEISPYWIIGLQSQEQRDHLESVFVRENIETRRWWQAGCHAMPAYSQVPHGPLPITDQIAQTYVGLPFFRNMTEQTVTRLRRGIEKASLTKWREKS